MGFWIKVVKKEPRAKRVSTAYPFYPFTRFMHRLHGKYLASATIYMRQSEMIRLLFLVL